MKGFKVFFISLVVLMLSITGVCGEDIKEEVIPEILIIYQAKDSNLENLVALVTSFGKTIEMISIEDYKKDKINSFGDVIFLKLNDIAIENENLRNDLLWYSGNLLYIGKSDKVAFPKLSEIPIKTYSQGNISFKFKDYITQNILINEIEVINKPLNLEREAIIVNGESFSFSEKVENLTYVPYFDDQEETLLCFSSTLKRFLGIDSKESMVLIVKEVFPFSDLTMIKKMSDAFYENGIPFTLGVIPLSDNTDYPAMKRFYDTLKYAQSKNGSIVAYALNKKAREVSGEPMEKGLTAMVNNGVYPLGIVVSKNWILEEYPYTNVSFSSGIIGNNPSYSVDAFTKSSTDFVNATYGISMETLEKTRSLKKEFGTYSLTTGIMVDLPKSDEELYTLINSINEKWLSLTDYKALDHQVKVGRNEIIANTRGVFLNGNLLSLAYEAGPIEETYQYQPLPTYTLGNVFNTGNTVLLIIMGAIIIGFLLMLFISRRLYLKKFRHKKSRKRKEGDQE